MKFYQNTHVGKIRSNNEDYLGIMNLNDKVHLLIVADGMGGHNKGEIASELATEIVINAIKNNCDKIIDLINEESPALIDFITKAIVKANSLVYSKSLEDDFFGMGTTMVCALISKDKMWIFNVGDSRCYILRNSGLKQLTKDNSYVQELVESGVISQVEALTHANKNMITRAIGTDSSVVVDTYEYSIYPGDQILLCSDGLTNMLGDEDIKRILNSEKNISISGELLIEKALEAGGADNVSLILADYNDEVKE